MFTISLTNDLNGLSKRVQDAQATCRLIAGCFCSSCLCRTALVIVERTVHNFVAPIQSVRLHSLPSLLATRDAAFIAAFDRPGSERSEKVSPRNDVSAQRPAPLVPQMSSQPGVRRARQSRPWPASGKRPKHRKGPRRPYNRRPFRHNKVHRP